MSEQIQQSQSSIFYAPTIPQRLGYVSRTKPRVYEIDYYDNKRIVLPYQTYEKTIEPQLTLNQQMKDNKDYQKVREQLLIKRNEILAQLWQQSYGPLMDLIGKNKDFKFKKIWSNLSSFEEWKKSRKNLRQKKWAGSSEDISGDNFPEFVVHDHNGFIRSYHGLRITVPIKCQRITKYFSENLTQEERATTHQKQWKEEDKPADCYRHFIKHYLSPFLKVRGYTVPQVHSVIGGRIWKGINAPWVLQYYDKSYQAQSFVGGDAILLTINRILSKVIKYVYNQYFIAGQSEQRNSQMKRLIQVGYAAFWNCQLSEIPDDANDDEEYIFTVVSEDAIKAAKQQRNEIRANEEKKNIKRVWQKIRVRQVIKFNDGMSLEKARLLPYDVLNI